MKPSFLIFFSIIFISSLAFAALYTFAAELVETNPAIFAIGLVSVITISLIGMLFSITSYSTVERRA